MFCEQIYSLIPPSLLPHEGIGKKKSSGTIHDIEQSLLYILLLGQYLIMVRKTNGKKGI